jgi:alpha-D-xyloside xylohydrolase
LVKSENSRNAIFPFENADGNITSIKFRQAGKNILRMSICGKNDSTRRTKTVEASLGKFSIRKTGKCSLQILYGSVVIFSIPENLPPGKRGFPGKLSVSENGINIPFEISENEGIYGLGEFFGDLNRNGQNLSVNVRDAFGLPNDETYVTYPFFWSTRGYGLFLNSDRIVNFDFGHNFKGIGEIGVRQKEAELFLFAGKPNEIIRAYWKITGKPNLPPLWSFGLWMSRCSYKNHKELVSIARKIRARQIPCDMIHLDPDWLRRPVPYSIREMMIKIGVDPAAYGEYYGNQDVLLARIATDFPDESRNIGYPGEGCTFEWDNDKFPEPSKTIEELHKLSFRLSLWINPYVPRGSKAFDELLDRGLMVSDEGGVPIAMFDRITHDFGAVDFTNPEGRKWFAGEIDRLLDLGVDILKTDYGEGAPYSGKYHGMEADDAHNIYPTLYNEVVFEAVRRKKGDGIVWGRSGGRGIHRYPIQWGGDPRCFERDMLASLRGALSYSLSGGAFMSFDIGGFAGRPTPELYIRWAEMGLLFSHSRAHGNTPREPWYFGKKAEEIFIRYDRLRYSLIPYLYWQSVKSLNEGRTLVRALVSEFVDDPFARDIQDEYMLGDYILVAPIVSGKERKIYLPDGRWHDFWTGRCIEGPSLIDYVAPLDTIPVFIRDGAALVTAEGHPQFTDETIFSTLKITLYGDLREKALSFGRYGKLKIVSNGGKTTVKGSGLLASSSISVKKIKKCKKNK